MNARIQKSKPKCRPSNAALPRPEHLSFLAGLIWSLVSASAEQNPAPPHGPISGNASSSTLIELKVVFAELPRDEASSFLAENGLGNSPSSDHTKTLPGPVLRKDVEKWLAAPENYLVEEFTAITPDKVMAEIQPTNFIRVFSPVGSFRLDPALVDDFFRSLNGDARRNATGVQISPEAIGAGMIRLGAVSTAVECIGYDDPGLLGVTDSPVLRSTLKDSGYLPAQLPGPGNSLNSGLLNSAAQLPLPRFRIRQTSAVGLVKEGETVLLGNFPVQQSMRPDPAGGPILGNLPRLGGYFSYSKYELAHRTLLIFVTPRIVPASP